MSESLEAEIFSKQLDEILAGRAPSADLDPEMAKDLAFSAKLGRLDLSGENRAKKEMKVRLLQRAEGNRLRLLLARVGVRPSVLAACAVLLILGTAALILAPSGEHFSMVVPPEHFAGKNSGMFGSASSAYESGYSMGSAVGGAISGAANSAPSARGFSGGKFGDLSGTMKAGGNSLNLLQGTGELVQKPLDREGYGNIEENPYEKVADHPLSTFSIDVDGASYSNVRRMLDESRMPPADAVRVEEFINYFHYQLPEPTGEHPFSITTELAACPWNPKHKLVRIGIKGKSIAKENLPPNNLVFLIDSSGSMMSEERLPLIKKGLRLLVEQMRKQDRISIVAYAGQAGLVLPATSGKDKETILAAIEKLEAGGSTAGRAGIQLAYKVAADNFMKNGNNRVILATDGDFNVGVTSDGELTKLIEEKREHGVYLSVLGVGRDNVQDHKMEQLADKGNGNYAYLDGILEAQKVLVKEMGATLLTIAKDVKIQVEFNPARVQSYRLIGYEDRMLRAEDFNNDKKDAGELGAGGNVTALYEVVPAGTPEEGIPAVDELKYQKPRPAADAEASKDLLTVKFRYKKPKEDKSILISRPLADEEREWAQASPDFKFAAGAAGFGMTLRGSKTRGDLTYEKVRAMAKEGIGADEEGYRAEMLKLVDKAALLDNRTVPAK